MLGYPRAAKQACCAIIACLGIYFHAGQYLYVLRNNSFVDNSQGHDFLRTGLFRSKSFIALCLVFGFISILPLIIFHEFPRFSVSGSSFGKPLGNKENNS